MAATWKIHCAWRAVSGEASASDCAALAEPVRPLKEGGQPETAGKENWVRYSPKLSMKKRNRCRVADMLMPAFGLLAVFGPMVAART